MIKPMTLPLAQLFLADLPPEAPLTPTLLREACITVKRNRFQWLARRRTQELAELIAYAAERWRRPEDPFRRLALTAGVAETGFGRETMARGLDAFFRPLTVEAILQWVAQDLGDARRLDEFCGTQAELRAGRLSLARGPELLAQFAAGGLPNSTWVSMTLGLLLRSAQFIKCARGSSVLPRLWAHSLADLEPKVAGSLELAVWPGGTHALEAVVLAESDFVMVHGTDAAVADLRQRTPDTARFAGYGHRASFGFVGADALSSFMARKAAERAAADVAAWNQSGCLSPHLIYVEDGGVVSPEGFAELLAAALAAEEDSAPRGRVDEATAAGIRQRRDMHTLRGAHHEMMHREAVTAPRGAFFEAPAGATRVWASDGSTAWTVVYEADSRFRLSCLNRFVYVKPCRGLADALHHAEAMRGKVGAVGIAAGEGRAQELAQGLAAWGVPRICPLGRMQEPPMAWRHDGRPALGDLATWTDWEQ